MKIYLVGGAIRDNLMGREQHDRDWLVVGATVAEFMKEYPKAQKVGKHFPVFLVHGDEFAFARVEVKAGPGHQGFTFDFHPEVTLLQDLTRRDFTINAMVRNIDEFHDPYGGRKDIKERVIRHICAKHFGEDPLRVFRAARFAATLGFTVAPETMDLLRSMKDSLSELSAERVFWEMRKALDSPKPSRFFEVLKEADCLGEWFPEIAALVGVSQPCKYHPEGDAFIHTMGVIDREELTTPIARYGALCHDLGKALTPKEEWPKHHGHDERGDVPVRDLSNRLRVPNDWKGVARKAASLHVKLINTTRPGKLLRLAREVKAIWPPIQEILIADDTNQVESKKETLKAIERINGALAVMDKVTGQDVLAKYPDLRGPAVGVCLHEMRTKALKVQST